MTKKNEAGFTPHAHQQIALDSLARFIACISGIQGGKTTIGAVWLCREIWESYQAGKRGDWLICAPTSKILEQSTLVKFKQFFPSDWGIWREQRKCFELAWGDKIFVRSADEPDYLEGMTILGAWIDEAGQIKNQAWINIQGRLSINQGRCIMTSTPYTFNWLHRDILKKAGWLNGVIQDKQDADPNIAVVEWTSIDNPAFPKEEYDRAKKSLSAETFQKRYEGRFTRAEGLVYKDFDHDEHIVEWFPIPDSWKRFAGLDWGFANATAILCIAQSPEKLNAQGEVVEASTFYVYREFYKNRPSLKEIAEFIEAEQLSYILADPSGAFQISELQRHYGTKRIQAADNDVGIGIERIQVLIRDGRIKFVGKRVPNTIREIEEYHYAATDPDKNTPEKPVAVNNHAMDALKYAFSRDIKGVYLTKPKIYKRARRTQLEIYADPFTGY